MLESGLTVIAASHDENDQVFADAADGRRKSKNPKKSSFFMQLSYHKRAPASRTDSVCVGQSSDLLADHCGPANEIDTLLTFQTVPADLRAPGFSSALKTVVRLRVDDIKFVYFFFNQRFDQLIACFHAPSNMRCLCLSPTPERHLRLTFLLVVTGDRMRSCQ